MVIKLYDRCRDAWYLMWRVHTRLFLSFCAFISVAFCVPALYGVIHGGAAAAVSTYCRRCWTDTCACLCFACNCVCLSLSASIRVRSISIRTNCYSFTRGNEWHFSFGLSKFTQFLSCFRQIDEFAHGRVCRCAPFLHSKHIFIFIEHVS